MGHKVRYGT